MANEGPGGFVQLIQLSISPVILISGVGMLLLTLTNRLGRIVDRARAVHGRMQTEIDASALEGLRRQLAILFRRARIVRLAIQLAAASVLTSGILILVLFAAALSGHLVFPVAALLFVTAVVLLVSSVVTFLRDLRLALEALEIETGTAAVPRPSGAAVAR